MWPCVCLRIMTRYYSYAILDYMCTKSTKSKHVGVARLGPDTRVPCYLKKRTVHGLKKERALEIMCHFIHSRTLWEEGKANRTRPNWICCTEWLIIVLSKGSGCLYCQGNEADSFFGWNVFIYLFIVQNNLDLIALFFFGRTRAQRRRQTKLQFSETRIYRHLDRQLQISWLSHCWTQFWKRNCTWRCVCAYIIL